MKIPIGYKAACGLISCLLISLFTAGEVIADGSEQLGMPSIPIAEGSDVIVEGVGLVDGQPGQISIEIPAGVSVEQVLLYWNGTASTEHGVEDTILVNGSSVTGPLIGASGPKPGTSADSGTYRADVTASNWVVAGAVNLLSVEGLDFDRHNNGAAVMVILDDGSASNIQILDGDDSAYLTHGYQTMPIDFPVVPMDTDVTGSLWMIVSDIHLPRPSAVEITVDGVTTQMVDVLQENEGDFLSVVELEVLVPAGATNVTVQVLSINDGSGLDPASLVWMCAALTLPEPYDPPEGCTYTIGYWKNHPDQWPVDQLSLFTKHEAMLTLWTPPKKGNAYLILAHQYIGAELNVVNGTSIPDEVLVAWFAAQELLIAYEDEGTIPRKSEDRDWAIDLAEMLDDYNNGLIGPGHCD